MFHYRIVVTALAAAVLAVTPAVAAHATPPPPSDPDPHSGGDAVIYPEGYPVAVLEMPALVRPGAMMEVVLDDSTGDVVSQELWVTDATGEPWAAFRCDGPPGEDCWFALSLQLPGVYTATLTVTGPAGETTSASQDFLVFRVRPVVLEF